MRWDGMECDGTRCGSVAGGEIWGKRITQYWAIANRVTAIVHIGRFDRGSARVEALP